MVVVKTISFPVCGCLFRYFGLKAKDMLLYFVRYKIECANTISFERKNVFECMKCV